MTRGKPLTRAVFAFVTGGGEEGGCSKCRSVRVFSFFCFVFLNPVEPPKVAILMATSGRSQGHRVTD